MKVSFLGFLVRRPLFLKFLGDCIRGWIENNEKLIKKDPERVNGRGASFHKFVCFTSVS